MVSHFFLQFYCILSCIMLAPSNAVRTLVYIILISGLVLSPLMSYVVLLSLCCWPVAGCWLLLATCSLLVLVANYNSKSWMSTPICAFNTYTHARHSTKHYTKPLHKSFLRSSSKWSCTFLLSSWISLSTCTTFNMLCVACLQACAQYSSKGLYQFLAKCELHPPFLSISYADWLGKRCVFLKRSKCTSDSRLRAEHREYHALHYSMNQYRKCINAKLWRVVSFPTAKFF